MSRKAKIGQFRSEKALANLAASSTIVSICSLGSVGALFAKRSKKIDKAVQDDSSANKKVSKKLGLQRFNFHLVYNIPPETKLAHHVYKKLKIDHNF